MPSKTVLITGCSDGSIGAALAQSFQRHNFHVFATARKLSKMQSLSTFDNVTLIELDVSSQDSIDHAIDTVRTRANGKLDCLVNNAGQLIMAPSLDVDNAAARRMFDANFWGVVDLVKAFAPMIIEAKGTIVNTGSIAGLLNVPFGGLYAASKAALMTFSENLRLELAPFDVKVLTVVTGVVQSNLGSENADFALAENSLYKAATESIKERAKGGGSGKMELAKYADALVDAVVKGRSGKIWLGGATTAALMLQFLPAGSVVSRREDTVVTGY
ncbi:NAD(P)-binding protein [Rhizodiscina lignyota]|uniref:NAD(P)-binding protein n=1 Tax=Rhizodiscina lignyota TaxID=1504668 RepID=A0A9P4I6U4_9PEZI|nr:NAD(P)-binding protein [Rhizodiscina lignyota]